MIQNLPVDRIISRSDARAVDADAVTRLVDSIATVGLINPVRVRAAGDRWEVIAGAHRVEAYRRLGLAEIGAEVVEDDDLHAELAMIDENLCRAELSPGDRARQTARRKAIYLELHPETAQGAVGRAGYDEKDGQVVHSFADATAALTGSDARTVRRDAERGEKVIPEVLDLIKGTKLDTGTYLDKLKRLPPNEQVTAAKRDLAFERQKVRQQLRAASMKPADIPLDDEAAQEKQFAALIAAWNKAGPEVRQRFREEVVDQPVFDRSAA